MLQRMQTLWTLLAVACGGLTYKFSFYSGNRIGIAPAKIFQTITAGSVIFINIFTVTIVVGGLINIFNFKNRKRQLWGTIFLILISLVNIFLYYRETQTFIEGNFSITAVLALAIPVLLIPAARGIMKDEKLVKSADRLR